MREGRWELRDETWRLRAETWGLRVEGESWEKWDLRREGGRRREDWDLRLECWELRAEGWGLRAEEERTDTWERRLGGWYLRSETGGLILEIGDLNAESWDWRAEGNHAATAVIAGCALWIGFVGCGRTPWQTWIDGMRRWNEKVERLNNPQSAEQNTWQFPPTRQHDLSDQLLTTTY
jgi:hypothetical protein